MKEKKFNKEDGSSLKLFTPGPVKVPERILEELKKPNDTHRSKSYEEMHALAVKGLKELMFTKNDCYLFTNSATGVMEACVRNLIQRGDKALFLSAGAFGDRWYDIALANEKNAIKESIPWGEAIKPEFVKQTLSKEKYSIVFIQSNETSTGVYHPMDKIAPIIKDSGCLLCVDATSSLGGIKLEVDKLGIDVCLASVQKCLALPPGLSVASISEEALEKTEKVNDRGYYFNFLNFAKKNLSDQTPTTPPIPQIRALVSQLDFIIRKEGLENRFKRHEKLGKRTRIWARDIVFEMFAEEGYESNTVSTMENTIEINFQKMISNMLDKGYRIVNGYGSLADKTFRIGHMGEITLKELEEMLAVLTDVITDLRLKQK